MGLRADSVGNGSVTCRSTENRIEGQLTDQVNSHYVPVADYRLCLRAMAADVSIAARFHSSKLLRRPDKCQNELPAFRSFRRLMNPSPQIRTGPTMSRQRALKSGSAYAASTVVCVIAVSGFDVVDTLAGRCLAFDGQDSRRD